MDFLAAQEKIIKQISVECLIVGALEDKIGQIYIYGHMNSSLIQVSCRTVALQEIRVDGPSTYRLPVELHKI